MTVRASVESAASLLMRLDSAVTVRDIMTPREDLVCGRDEADAREQSRKENYLVVPIAKSKGDEITEYFDRDDAGIRLVDKAVLISDGASVSEVLWALAKRPYYFVLVGDSIGGYVHYSDLNKPPTRIPIFAMLAYLESNLARELPKFGPWERLCRSALEESRFTQLKRNLKRQKREETDLGWCSVLCLPDILRIAKSVKLIELDDESVTSLRKLRNSVEHPVGDLSPEAELATSFESVSVISQSVALCRGFLRSIDQTRQQASNSPARASGST